MPTSTPNLSLYRKWRPQTFNELQGQDAIRDTLFYALTHGQMTQSYLFCGPRGTGKTTTARLIAKLINCIAEGEAAKPCNTCASCTTITEGANFDVIELDAASNRGIEEIRQLRESVRFSPTQAKYKVFIIDEVHMLTREAFNALLKTLEEPPKYALFILATTEAHKIPPTIISRCQRYDFRLATEDTLAEHLMRVAKEEGIALHEDAARFIARLGEGSFRDSLSLLDQVRSSEQKEYTREVVEGLFGYIPEEHMAELLAAIFAGESVKAHGLVDDALARGADLKALADQLLGLSQRVLEAVSMQDVKSLPGSLADVAKKLSLGDAVTWLTQLLDAVNQMKQSPIARLPLDLVIAKAAVPKQAAPAVSVAAPAFAVAPKPVKPAPTPEVVPSVPVVHVTEEPPVHETVSVPVAVVLPESLNADDWQNVLKALKESAPSLVTSLSHARVDGINGDVLQVSVRYKMHADKINQPTNRVKIETVLNEVMGAPLKIQAQVVKDLPVEEETVDISEVFEFE